MARGIQIPFTLDVRQWRKGIRTVELDIDDLGDAFQDLERDADRAADDIEDAFRNVGDAAKRAGDDLEDGVGSGLRDGNLKTVAGAAAGEIVDEFVENWGEAVRSGDYAGALRETLSQLGQVGGAIGGPAGAIIGGALALGLTQAFDSITNNRLVTAVRESFNSLADEAIAAGGESGRNFVDEFYRAMDTEEARRDALQSFFDTETFGQAMNELVGLAQQLGVDEQVVFDVVSGTNVERQNGITKLTESRDLIQQELDRQIELNVRDDVGNRLNQDKIDKLRRQLGQYDALLRDAGVLVDETRNTRDNLALYEGLLDNAGGKVDTMKAKLREANGEAGALLGTFQQAGRTVISVRVNADTTAFYSSVRDAMAWAARGTNVPI